MKNDDQLDSKYALNVVKEKLLDSLKALEHCQNLEERVREFEEHRAKGPLSLNAVPEGPRLHLLWASFQQVEEEAGTVSIVSFYYGYFPELIISVEAVAFYISGWQSYWFQNIIGKKRI